MKANNTNLHVFHQPVGRDPEVVIITLKKPLKSGMGVSIVAAKVTVTDWGRNKKSIMFHFETVKPPLTS